MVLSNKKLKQKLRAEVAQSLAASEPSQGATLQPQTFKTLLNSVTQKPRLSKREVRRAKQLSSDDSKPPEKGGGGFQTQYEDVGLGSEEKQRKSEKKKRKRADAEGGLGKEVGDGDGGLTAEKKAEKKKKKEKEKKKKEKEKKKKKKEKKKKRKKEGSENCSGESKEMGATDSQKIGTSQENGNSATKVYVGGIPYYSTEDDIRSFFESCGTVTEVDCMMFPDSGKFRGIAILTFKTEAAAKRALALNSADMGGLLLKIKPYKVAQPQRPLSDFSPGIVDGYNRIYVGNLSWDVTEEDLRKLFSDCQISAIRFGHDKTTGEFRGYAHVDFSDSLSFSIALKLDQQVVCERPVRIRCAVPKKVPGTHSTPGSSNGTKNADDGAGGTVNMNKDTESAGSTGSAKKKSRKCYECGVKGHLSSACPQKQVLNVENSGSGS